MSSGTVKFYVDDVECPETNGVGVQAVGGVFNCNLEGYTFKAVCTDTCYPSMFVLEMQVFTKTALTAVGEPYIFEGNASHINNASKEIFQSDQAKLWSAGSYFGTGSLDDNGDDFYMYALSKGTARVPGANFDWGSLARVSRALFYTQYDQ